MPDEAVALVQFLHPGSEHRPDGPGHRSWNTGMHRRKFMTAEASFNDGDAWRDGLVTLWGEWEPPSRVAAMYPRDGELPRFLHEPVLTYPESFQGLQNTDPYVFGERFLYTGCQQHTNRGRSETQLRRLMRGSVILFGSCRADRFLLDTVFVVADSIDHHLTNHRDVLADAVPEEYWTVTMGPWYADGGGTQSFRLYRGAIPEEPVHGMYGFVPCLPADGGARRFARPEVRLRGSITPHLRQGRKITRFDSFEAIRNAWEQVRAQVEDAGLSSAVRIQHPSSEAR